MVNDKDISGVLSMLPKNATYYFTKASVKRALSEKELQSLAMQSGLHGDTYPDVETAVTAAKEKANKNDFIFVGGSSFIVDGFIKNFTFSPFTFIEKVWEYRRKSFYLH